MLVLEIWSTLHRASALFVAPTHMCCTEWHCQNQTHPRVWIAAVLLVISPQLHCHHLTDTLLEASVYYHSVHVFTSRKPVCDAVPGGCSSGPLQPGSPVTIESSQVCASYFEYEPYTQLFSITWLPTHAAHGSAHAEKWQYQ